MQKADWFEHNIQLIEKNNPRLAERLYEAKKESRMVSMTGLKGFPTLKVEGYGTSGLLHSRYYPIEEAQKWWEKERIGKHWDSVRQLVLYGLGFGYMLPFILEDLPEETFITIVEPSPEIFAEYISVYDISQLLENPRIQLIVEENLDAITDDLYRLVADSMLDVAVAEWWPYERLFPQKTHKWRKKFIETSISVRIDQNTLLHFSQQWPKNVLENTLGIVRSPSVAEFFEAFKQVPIIVVSAGPSLSKNVHLLKEAKGKAVIICVDTALRAMLKHGIHPDLVVAIDGSELNYRHFAGLPDLNIPLVFIPTTHPQIVDEYGKRSIVSLLGNHLLKFIGKYFPDKSGLAVGGSVATVAFELAYHMGGDPIVFVGQDLAYPEGKSHAEGTIFEDIRKKESDKNMVYVTGIDGKPVLTDLSLRTYLQWFEERIAVFKKERKIIDATEGGAFIQGTEILSLTEVLDRYCQVNRNITETIDDILERYEPEGVHEFLEGVRTTRKTFRRLQRTAAVALSRSKTLLNYYEQEMKEPLPVKKILNQLERIDQKIQAANKEELIDEILQGILLNVIRGKYTKSSEHETIQEEGIRVFKNSCLFYQGVMEASKIMDEYMQRAEKDVEKFLTVKSFA